MKNKKVKLGDYIEEYSVKNKQGYQYPVYSVTNSNGFCTEYFNKDVSSKDKRNYKIVPYGCFAYNPSRINVGSIDWQHYEKNVIVSPLYIVFKCSNKIKQKYLQYFFESEYGKHLINSKVSGSVRANLKFSSMCDFELNIGTIEEQQKIISTIDKINKLINAQKQQLEKLDELIKSKFVEMFGTLHNNKNNYSIETLENICELIKDGTHQTPKYVDDKKNGYIFVSSKDIVSHKIDWNNTKRISKELHDILSKTVSPRKNDLLLSKNGTIGFAALVEENKVFDIYVSVALLRQQKLNNIFFRESINFEDCQRQLKSNLKGIGVPNLHLGEIKKCKILVPPLDRQNNFAEFVKKIENLKEKFQKQIDLYTELLNKKRDEYFN